MIISGFTAKLSMLLDRVPSDAFLTHLGSYRRCHQRFGHNELQLPQVAAGITLRDGMCFGCVHRRSNMSGIIGTIGHVVHARGGRRLITPVIAPADVLFSMQRPPVHAPSPSYGPTDFLVWPAPVELGLERATHLSAPRVGATASPLVDGHGALPNNLTARQRQVQNHLRVQSAERLRKTQMIIAAREAARHEKAAANELEQANMSCIEVKYLRRQRHGEAYKGRS